MQKFIGINSNFSNINFQSPRILNFLIKDKANLFVWGWAPQLYVLSYKFPSDRATISQKNIENYSNKDYFNKRLVNDFIKYKPNIIIDAVKPKSFYYTEGKYSIKENSPIKDQINLNYTLLTGSNSNCLDIYLQKKDYEKLKKLVEYNIDNTSIENKLNDFSVNEEICNNSYIFKLSDENMLKLKLKEEAYIKNVLILASRKNTKQIELEMKLIKNKQETIVKKIKLKNTLSGRM